MSAERVKQEALASLVVLAETCKSSLAALHTLYKLTSNHGSTEPAPVETIRKDALSLHRLIHTSATRLAISLGKPPPSYAVALVPLKDLTSQVAQLPSCISAFPPGILRKEAAWGAEDTIRALEGLVESFESRSRRGEQGKMYLAQTGALHDAVTRAEALSGDEREAFAKAWKANGETLADSLKEVEEMMVNKKDERLGSGGDGWDELGEEFGAKLNADERERVNKIYPLVRFTTLLHEKILSHHILKLPPLRPCQGRQLASLLAASYSLQVANDDLVSSLYAPQDIDAIQGAIKTVHGVTHDLDQQLGATEGDVETVTKELAALWLDKESQNLVWFRKCFSQLDSIYEDLLLVK